MVSRAPINEETAMSGPGSADSFEKGRYRETCGACGAVFEVVVLGGQMAKNTNEHLEEYDCPECKTSYRCRGSQPPKVKLLEPRTDGR